VPEVKIVEGGPPDAPAPGKSSRKGLAGWWGKQPSSVRAGLLIGVPAVAFLAVLSTQRRGGAGGASAGLIEGGEGFTPGDMAGALNALEEQIQELQGRPEFEPEPTTGPPDALPPADGPTSEPSSTSSPADDVAVSVPTAPRPIAPLEPAKLSAINAQLKTKLRGYRQPPASYTAAQKLSFINKQLARLLPGYRQPPASYTAAQKLSFINKQLLTRLRGYRQPAA
jgi:hypothetical protein